MPPSVEIPKSDFCPNELFTDLKITGSPKKEVPLNKCILAIRLSLQERSIQSRSEQHQVKAAHAGTRDASVRSLGSRAHEANACNMLGMNRSLALVWARHGDPAPPISQCFILAR